MSFSLSASLRIVSSPQIGEVSTPWPAFSIVASNSGHFLSGHDRRAAEMFRHRFLPALAEGAAFFKTNTMQHHHTSISLADTGSAAVVQEKKRESIIRQDIQFDSNAVCDDSVSLIVKRFGHQQEDAQRWLDKTQYALPDMSVDAERMRRALQTLQKVGLVPDVYPVRRLWGGAADVLCNDAVSFRHGLGSPNAVPIPTVITEESKEMSTLLRSALML